LRRCSSSAHQVAGRGWREGRRSQISAGSGAAERRCFYPPTLLWNVHPSSTVAIEDIVGPLLVAMAFRTPDEAVTLANNTRYGLAGSVSSETIGLALDIAPKLMVGVIWINATNLFDAGVGFWPLSRIRLWAGKAAARHL
jgi:aldehyde dehydrogenase (NAD+)